MKSLLGNQLYFAQGGFGDPHLYCVNLVCAKGIYLRAFFKNFLTGAGTSLKLQTIVVAPNCDCRILFRLP